MQQQERAAADAGRLRLGQPEHQLHGDRRVDRRAALREDRVAGVDRVRIGRRDHPVPRGDRLLVDPAGRMLGRGLLRQRDERRKQRDEDRSTQHQRNFGALTTVKRLSFPRL